MAFSFKMKISFVFLPLFTKIVFSSLIIPDQAGGQSTYGPLKIHRKLAKQNDKQRRESKGQQMGANDNNLKNRQEKIYSFGSLGFFLINSWPESEQEQELKIETNNAQAGDNLRIQKIPQTSSTTQEGHAKNQQKTNQKLQNLNKEEKQEEREKREGEKEKEKEKEKQKVGNQRINEEADGEGKVDEEKEEEEKNSITLQEPRNQIKGNNNYVGGTGNDVEGQKNLLLGYKNLIRGNLNKMKGNDNFIAGNLTIIVGNLNSANGNGNKVNGTSNYVFGGNNLLTGNENQMLGNENNFQGNQAIIHGNNNQIKLTQSKNE